VSDIDELAARIEAHIAEDEATAKEAARGDFAEWRRHWLNPGIYSGTRDILDSDLTVLARVGAPVAEHIARNDPARALRRVKAVRELAAEIMAEGHYYDESGYYSCSQAREWAPVGQEPGPPGSGCSDRERAGKPCDCGRDATVARRLAIIASEWEPGA
jgi:hypothetical protein